jgi:hypothetical protein
MEQSSEFPDELQIVEVHWRWATWQDIYRLGSIDPLPKPPKGWGPIPHPWVILVPKAGSRFAWAYSRTSKMDFSALLDDIRLSHDSHRHECRILKLPGTLQFGESERLPVDINRFIKLHGNQKCDRESSQVLQRLVFKLKKVHKTSWNRPQQN